MAPKSYISLGPYNDIRPVIAKDLRQVPMDTANPFASPGGGNKGYNDLSGWAEFTMNDWQAGAGQQDPEAGGYLYGFIEGRVPGQLIHTQHVWPQTAWASAGEVNTKYYRNAYPLGPSPIQYYEGYQKFGPTNTGTPYSGKALAVRGAFDFPVTGLTAPNNNGSTIYFLCLADQDTQVRVSIYTGAVNPTTEVAFQVITVKKTGPLPRWQKATMAGTGVVSPSDWAVITPSSEIKIISISQVPASAYRAEDLWTDNVWSTQYSLASCVITHQSMMQDTGYSAAYARVGPFIQRGDSIYAMCGDKILKWVPPPVSTWSVADDVGVTLTGQMAVFDGVIYFGRASGNAYSLSAGDVHANLAYPAQTFYSDGSYLWKVNGTTISYSADAITWTDVVNAATSQYPVQAMASMAGTLYYITREGMFYIAPGDFCQKLFLFPDKSTVLPCVMVEFQGSLFVIGGNSLYRVDAGGSILPLPVPSNDPDLDEETTYLRSLAAGQNWLYVATSNAAETRGIIWSWQPEGWHSITIVPANPYWMLADKFENCVWIGDKGRSWRFRAVDGIKNPYFDTSSEFESYAWVSTDRFFGTNRILEKDIESVTIDGENLYREYPGFTNVSVYLKTDKTNDQWVFIDYVRSITGGTVRLSNFATMPRSCKWVQIGVLSFSIFGADPAVTPRQGTTRIRGISLKYTPMVNDRYRWRVDLTVPPRLLDVDAELYTGTYNQASMIAHIKACISSVVPIIFYDVDGSHYEVKVVAASRSIERVEPKRGGGKDVTYIWSLTLEQIMTGTTTY